MEKPGTPAILPVSLTLLTVGIIALGAFVRLQDAGLGCPDWPTCYGHVLWPEASDEIAVANERYSQTPVEVDKTWPEQVHRLFASLLGFFSLVLFFLTFKQAPRSVSRLFCFSAVTVSLSLLVIRIFSAGFWEITSTPIYDTLDPVIATGMAGLLITVLIKLIQSKDKALLSATLAVVMIVLQGLFGMWTVTLKLWPQVVTLHLLGGMFMAIIFFRIALTSLNIAVPEILHHRWLARAGIVAVVVQIALGGWLTANYAAVACPDFPTCQGQLWPDADFDQGFTVFQAIGPNYLGGQLHSEARAAIHIAHRLGAMGILFLCGALFFFLWRTGSGVFRKLSLIGMGALVIQIGLGVANVLFGFPLILAVLHNLGATFLLLTVTACHFYVCHQTVTEVRMQVI